MKLKDITPQGMACLEHGCPALFETDEGTFVLIGKDLQKGDLPAELPHRIGEGERAIEIPRKLLQDLLKK